MHRARGCNVSERRRMDASCARMSLQVWAIQMDVEINIGMTVTNLLAPHLHEKVAIA